MTPDYNLPRFLSAFRFFSVAHFMDAILLAACISARLCKQSTPASWFVNLAVQLFHSPPPPPPLLPFPFYIFSPPPPPPLPSSPNLALRITRPGKVLSLV